MNSLKLRSVSLSSAFAALALFSTTGSAFAGNGAGCCCHAGGDPGHHAAMFQAGDKVVVAVDGAKLVKGSETLATLKKGDAFDVLKVQGPWLGAQFDINGKKTSGWIAMSEVQTPADRTAGATPQQDERRSFSYEPSTVQPQAPMYQTYPSYPSYRRHESPRREIWQLPKTDPRRFGNGHDL